MADFVSSSSAHEKLYVFCANTHQHLQNGSQNNLNNRSQQWRQSFEKRMRNFQMPTVPRHTFAYHFEEITGSHWYI